MLQARKYMKSVGCIYDCRTFAPHAYLPKFLDDNQEEERALGLQFGHDLLGMCEALIICGERISSGMKSEIDKAFELGLQVFFYQEMMKGSSLILVQNRSVLNEMSI